MNYDSLVHLFLRVGKLKLVPRSGWITRVGVDSPESVADHTFRCAFLGMCIGDMLLLDTEKLVKMLLLHDIQETITGDLDSHEKQELGADKVLETENQAILELLSQLPAQQQADYLSIWREFNAQETPEAVVAKDIDKLEMLLQCLEYERDGYNIEKLAEFWKSVDGHIMNPRLKDMLHAIEVLTRASQ